MFDNYFQTSLQTHNYPTRYTLGDHHMVACFNKSSSKCSIRYVGFKLWNKLPLYIKETQINNFYIFSKLLI